MTIIYAMSCAAIPKGRKPAPSLITDRPENVSVACELVGISVAEARGYDRHYPLCRKRFEVMAIMQGWGRSTTQIGHALNRDHTTVVSGLRRLRQLQERDAIQIAAE